MKDYTAAVQWLRTRAFVNADRIGISGGSYGGYIACLALTNGSEYFTHGFASAPVTDWRLYDSIYTERYMDTPSVNPEGYRNGSVLTYADRLKGSLFLIHGEMDDNVHPINSIQLISRLQDLDKDFRFMLYPDGRHGWEGAKRRHSRRMETQFWLTYLANRTLDLRSE
jgi:dipeptidyl-peptidase-4